QAEDGIRDFHVTGVQTCALPISDAGMVAFTATDPVEARANHIHWLGHLDGLKTGRRAREELTFQARWAGADADGIAAAVDVLARSEERRGGKEGGWRGRLAAQDA